MSRAQGFYDDQPALGFEYLLHLVKRLPDALSPALRVPVTLVSEDPAGDRQVGPTGQKWQRAGVSAE